MADWEAILRSHYVVRKDPPKAITHYTVRADGTIVQNLPVRDGEDPDDFPKVIREGRKDS